MDTNAVLLGLAVVLVIGLLLAARNATVLFVVRIRAGKIVHVRGRVPQGLLSDLADVVKERPVSDAVIRARVEGGLVAVYDKGDLSPQERQRLRNVVGCWPLAKIRSSPFRSRAFHK